MPVLPLDEGPCPAESPTDRMAALAAWRAGRDVSGIPEQVLTDAAMLARPMLTNDGARFEARSFGALVDFLADMPF